MLSAERRIAAVRPVGWPHNLQASRGQGPSPVRARTARRPAKFLACCVRRAADDGQAAHGRPGQQRPIRPLAASLASSCPISSPWPAAAGGGSGRMGRPSARRPSSCDQCGSTAATEPRRGRPQACWSTAMAGELGARGRAARAPGRSAGFRPLEEAEVRRLSQLRADELADHLGKLALRQAPLVSSRLEAVLKEHAVFAADALRAILTRWPRRPSRWMRTPSGAPPARSCRSCIALWQDISASEARVHGCRASLITAARAGHPDRAGMAVARCLPALEPRYVPLDDEAWALVAPASTVTTLACNLRK